MNVPSAVDILLVEDSPDDFEQFRAAVERFGLYWLLLNEPPH